MRGSQNLLFSRLKGEGVGSLCQAELRLLLPWGSSWSGAHSAWVPRPGRDRHSPAQNKGLHELPGFERANARATSPPSRPGADSTAPAPAPAARGKQLKRPSLPADRDRSRCCGPGPDTTTESRPTPHGLLRAEPAARSPPPVGSARRPLSRPALTARAAGRTRSAMLCVTPTTGRAPSGNCRAESRSGGKGRSRPAAHGEWRKVPSAAAPPVPVTDCAAARESRSFPKFSRPPTLSSTCLTTQKYQSTSRSPHCEKKDAWQQTLVQQRASRGTPVPRCSPGIAPNAPQKAAPRLSLGSRRRERESAVLPVSPDRERARAPRSAPSERAEPRGVGEPRGPRGAGEPQAQRPRPAATSTAAHANHPPADQWHLGPRPKGWARGLSIGVPFSQSTARSRGSPRPRRTRAAAASSARSFRHAPRAALCLARAGAAAPPPPRSRSPPANGARCLGGGDRRRSQLGPRAAAPPPARAGRGGTGTAAAPARPEPSAAPSPAEPGGAGTAAGFRSSPGKRSAPLPGAGLPPPAKLGGPLGSAPAASRAGGSGHSPGVPGAAGAGAAEAAAGEGAGTRRLRDGIDAADPQFRSVY
ncbi:uncharacterized protein ACIQIH_014013 [Cyanocitta cristata]